MTARENCIKKKSCQVPLLYKIIQGFTICDSCLCFQQIFPLLLPSGHVVGLHFLAFFPGGVEVHMAISDQWILSLSTNTFNCWYKIFQSSLTPITVTCNIWNGGPWSLEPWVTTIIVNSWSTCSVSKKYNFVVFKTLRHLVGLLSQHNRSYPDWNETWFREVGCCWTINLRNRISLGVWSWAVKELEVVHQCQVVMKQLVKLAGTDNGFNNLVALETPIKNPNVSSMHYLLLATFDKVL